MMDPIFIDIPNHGEDAPPYASDGVIIVCDGLGGSGNQAFEVDGETASGAHFASRETSRLVRGFLESNRDTIIDSSEDDRFAAELRETIIRGLKEYSDAHGISVEKSLEKMGIRGNVFRNLPTTLASIVYGERDGKIVTVTFWAGDSRCFCLDPTKGLMQLTTDDGLRPQDAMESLIDDSPMSNVINISEDFRINCARYVFDAPCLLMAASDGMFGYQDTPMHFEYEFIPRGENFDLKANIVKETESRHNDDCTLACVPIGVESVDEYNRLFGSRDDILRPMIDTINAAASNVDACRDAYRDAKKLPTDDPANIEKMDSTKQELSDARKSFDSIRKESWDGYKANYYPKDVCNHKPVEVVPLSDILSEYAVPEPEPFVESESSTAEAESISKVDEDVPAEEVTEAISSSEVEVESETAGLVSVKRIILDISSTVEEKTSTIRSIGKYRITGTFKTESGFLSSYGIKRVNRRDTRYEIYIRPSFKDDDYRREIISSHNFISMSSSTKGLRSPVECGTIDEFFWMAYVISQSTVISIDLVPEISPINRLQLIESVASLIGKLHESGYILGSVSPYGLRFIRNPDDTCRAEVRNLCAISDVRGKIRIDGETKLDKSYDLNCLGILICEMYTGRCLDCVDENTLPALIGSFPAKIDQEIIHLTERILFGYKLDISTIIAEMKRISTLKNSPRGALCHSLGIISRC